MDLTSYNNASLRFPLPFKKRIRPSARPPTLPISIIPHPTYSFPSPHVLFSCFISYVAAVDVAVFAWFANRCIPGTRFPLLPYDFVMVRVCVWLCVEFLL